MSIRRAILEDSPFVELIREKSPNWCTEFDAFEYALEGYLRTVSELGALVVRTKRKSPRSESPNALVGRDCLEASQDS
jgi:hypothetical protein